MCHVSGVLMSYRYFEHPNVRVYFSQAILCGSLFHPWFFCEAGFYLYSAAVYASDVLGNVPTCPNMQYYYF